MNFRLCSKMTSFVRICGKKIFYEMYTSTINFNGIQTTCGCEFVRKLTEDVIFKQPHTKTSNTLWQTFLWKRLFKALRYRKSSICASWLCKSFGFRIFLSDNYVKLHHHSIWNSIIVNPMSETFLQLKKNEKNEWNDDIRMFIANLYDNAIPLNPYQWFCRILRHFRCLFPLELMIFRGKWF